MKTRYSQNIRFFAIRNRRAVPLRAGNFAKSDENSLVSANPEADSRLRALPTYFLSAPTATATQPTIRATPPNGTIAPSHFHSGDANVNTFKSPQKMRIPAKKA